MSKLTIALTLLASVVLAYPISRVIRHAPIVPEHQTALIEQTSSSAFGALSKDAVSAVPVGATATSSSGSANPSVAPIGIFPAAYKYVYGGDPLTLSETSVDVLEHTNSGIAASSGLLEELNLGLINAASLSRGAVQTLSFTTGDGYTVYLDVAHGSVSLTSSLPIVEPLVQTQGTPDASLSDSDLLSIANAFVVSHGISTRSFGPPKVLQNPKLIYALPLTDQSSATTASRPEKIISSSTVLYPLIVNGMVVYTSWGDEAGMTLTIDSLTRTVSSLANLTTQNYQSSSYPAETDSKIILSVAEQGGLYGVLPETTKTATEITLETPSRVLLQLSHYSNGENHDLLVPALRFVVKDPPPGFQSSILVPLAKELIVSESPPPVPLPPEGSSSSGGTPTIKPN